ncbi:hypothetical protein IMSHALPRED_009165 [Imshaugia aleurites]|uniref:Uncharacterized protein n=1 Tax=Imshaugia aleurites TaxID=172621 RepID=A0A8H3I0L8_9LECA|nr:hypothetical protein IMSHALPRED_009165 [Imshaugia aleurites]
MATVLGGTLGSLIRKEKTDSKASSEDGSKTKNATVIVTHTTSISQDRLQMLRRRRLLFPLLLRVHPSLRWGLVKHTLISHLLRSLYLETGPEVMESSGDAFDSVTTTLDACISLCAAYNAINGTGPLGYCTSVEWRMDLSDDCPGCCYGNFDQKAGVGEPTIDGEVVPVDAAYFLGWS